MSQTSAGASQAAAGDKAAEERAAVIAGASCYFFWGFLPLLFMGATWAGAGAWEIVAWRGAWSVVWAAALVIAFRTWPQTVQVLQDPRTLAWLTVSAALVAVNWCLFVWVVSTGHTLDASLAYYLNPLMSVAAGMLLFRERIGPGGWTAIVLAAIGVVLQTVAHGQLPWAALVMAVAFCLYGVIRKRVAADATTGLFVECLILAGPSLAYGLWLEAQGAGHATQPLAGLLLFLGGPATVAPLAAFAWAARRMPLSTMGFLQFIGPTVQFGIGVAFGEHLPPLSVLAFVFIWAGVGVYAFTAWRKMRGLAPAR